jgi:outer membrane protein assembly factor BamB
MAYPSANKNNFPLWKDGLVRAAPVIDAQRNIYLATVSFANVYKFTPEGKELWKYNANDISTDRQPRLIPDVPAIMDGRLFFSTDHAEVIALDMETGKELWTTRVAERAAEDTWAMAAAEGVVVTAAVIPPSQLQFIHEPERNRRLVALRASDGAELWHFDVDPHKDGELFNILVSIKDGSCVFSTCMGKVYRLSLDSGKVIWETPMPPLPSFSTGGSAIGPNGIVYATWNKMSGSIDAYQWGEGMVGAFDFNNGKKLWSTSVGYEANNAAAVGRLANGRMGVVIGIGSNPHPPNRKNGILDGKGPVKKQRIVALDADTGEFFWTYQLPDWHGSALGDENRPDICLPDAFGNAAIGGDGSAYIGHASGFLYSVKDSDGDGELSPSEVATWQTGAAFQGSPGIAPDMLVATPCNGMHVWLSR